MAVEKIMFDVENPSNSSFVFNGFQQGILELLGLPKRSTHGVPLELDYNEVIDNLLKRPEVKTDKKLRSIKNKQTVVSEYMKDPERYERIPMVLRNAVVDIYYEKDETPKKQQITSGYIKSLSSNSKVKFPLIVNMLYGNFKHDPTPQIFAMHYDGQTNNLEGFNMKYLSLPELRKLIMFSIRYPKVDPFYFYHAILKPYSISKAIGMKIGNVRRLSTETISKKLAKASARIGLQPYKKYPAGARKKMKVYGGKRMFGDINTKTEKGFGAVNNLLLAYRKYKMIYCTFFNIPVDFFNEPENEE